MAIGDQYRQIQPDDRWIEDANGNIVGVQNPRGRFGSETRWLTEPQVAATQALVSGALIRQPNGSDSAPLDIFDLYSTGLPRKLTLPSPYSAVGPAMVHPSVVDVPTRWMGWRYWMACTPYPNNDSQYENPSILVSQDGELWEAPAGLTNPVVPKPASGYNADTELVLSPDGSRLYLLYRERVAGAANAVKCLESTDGVTWSAPRTIVSGAYGSQDYASPSLWWDSAAGVWRMIAHNLDGGAAYPVNLLANTGPDIYTGWGAPSVVTIANPTGGRTWWHSSMRRLPDGRIVGLVQDIVNGGAGATGALFVAESLDSGATFSVAKVYSDLTYYRPAFTVSAGQSGAGLTAFLGRIGAGSVQSIWREDWLPGAAQRKKELLAAEYTLTGSAASALWFDNFNRADGAIGSPIVGTALTVDTGTLTLTSGKLTTGSAGNNRGTVSVGTPDFVADFRLSAASGAAIWCIVRAVDTSNFWRIGVGAGLPATLYRERISAGSSASLVAITGPVISSTVSVGDVIRIACRGRRIRVYVNGVLWAEWADTWLNATGTRIGVQGTNAGIQWDDVLCVA